jgi:hypothetical protein
MALMKAKADQLEVSEQINDVVDKIFNLSEKEKNEENFGPLWTKLDNLSFKFLKNHEILTQQGATVEKDYSEKIAPATAVAIEQATC